MDRDRTTRKERVTPEVGDEGGSPGDLEIGRDSVPGAGSEQGETWRPVDPDTHVSRRDETGEGRRSPIGGDAD
jgi:hypothetical protein